MFSGRILLTDDNRSMRTLLFDELTARGFMTFSTTERGLRTEHISRTVADAAVISMQRSGGHADAILEKCVPFRIPVVILLSTVMKGAEGRYADMGAAEVIQKPLDIGDLAGRLRELMPGQMKKIFEPIPFRVEYGGMGADMLTGAAWAGEHTLDLKPTEFRLLRLFLAKHGIVMHRCEIAAGAWGENVNNERVVDVHVCRLKRALGEKYGDMIKTVRGEGYVLVGEDD